MRSLLIISVLMLGIISSVIGQSRPDPARDRIQRTQPTTETKYDQDTEDFLKELELFLDSIENSGGSTKTTQEDFCSALNKIVNDAKYTYSTYKGGEIPKEDDLDWGGRFYSKLSFPGAEESYFSKDLFSTKYKFIATFPDYTNKDASLTFYNQMASKLKACGINCCTMVSDEIVYDNLRNTYLLPFDLSGNMDAAYDKLNIEVEWIKSFKFDDSYNMIDIYYTVLRVNLEVK